MRILQELTANFAQNKTQQNDCPFFNSELKSVEFLKFQFH